MACQDFLFTKTPMKLRFLKIITRKYGKVYTKDVEKCHVPTYRLGTSQNYAKTGKPLAEHYGQGRSSFSDIVCLVFRRFPLNLLLTNL